MKGWKKWVVVILALLSVVASCVTLGSVLSKSRDDSGSITYIGPTAKLRTDKTVYEHGEPIMVTAYGSGTDWIGIVPQKADGTPDFTKSSIYWQYIMPDVGTSETRGQGSGVAVNIREGSVGKDITSDMTELHGTYYVVLVPNNGLVSKCTEIVSITVK